MWQLYSGNTEIVREIIDCASIITMENYSPNEHLFWIEKIFEAITFKRNLNNIKLLLSNPLAGNS